jgi:hypothetical protein
VHSSIFWAELTSGAGSTGTEKGVQRMRSVGISKVRAVPSANKPFDLLLDSNVHTLYALESACVKIVWQREFQLQEVKVLRFEVLGGNSPMNSIAVLFEAVRQGI